MPSPHQLPRDVNDFVDREHETTTLTDTLGASGLPEERASEDTAAATVIVISGMPGVGKSALAIHAAHRVRRRFPDAQLYADLRTSYGNPLDPGAVLASFLRALGINDGAIPEDPAERESVYRSVLAGRRALVLLDNAQTASQVRALLPAEPTSAVIITSRRPLSAVAGALPLHLDVLPETHALELIGHLAGAERIRAEIATAIQIVELCGRLPLAVRIAGATLSKRAHWSLAHYAERLADERTRLDQLKDEDLDVAACFFLSYRELLADAPSDGRLFRFLGLLVGQDFGVDTVAVLLDTPTHETEDALERLVELQLVEPSVGTARYRLHDLLRLFARERLAEAETFDAQRAAQLRIARWYLTAAADTNVLLWPDELQRNRAGELATRIGVDAQQEAEYRLVRQALTWFDRERPEVLAALEAAQKARESGVVFRLAASLVPFFQARSLWADWERSHLMALQAVREISDSRAELVTLHNLGTVYRRQGRWDDAIGCYEQAIAMSRDLGDHHSEGLALGNLGNVCMQQGRWDVAMTCYEDSLKISHDEGDGDGEAQTLNNLGILYGRQSRWAEAITCCESSLKIRRDRGDRYGESETLINLGILYARQGRWDVAMTCYADSLEISRDLGDRYGEGAALGNLGNVYTQQGRWDDAIKCFEQDLAISHDLGDRHGEGLTLINLGVVYQQQGRLETAAASWQEALGKLHPSSPEHSDLQAQLRDGE